jgi:soluble lytic murein transglycosylase-like protein
MKWLLSLLLMILPGIARAEVATSNAERCVQHYATQNRVPPELIAALIDVESRWNPRAVSSKGAMGLMQLMPATACETLRRIPTVRYRAEHSGGDALCDDVDVGVPR